MNRLFTLVPVRNKKLQTVRSFFASVLIAGLVSNTCAFAGALHEAAETGALTEIRRLLDAGADIQEKEPRWQASPLQIAAGNGKTEAVRLLLSRGAEVNARDENGGTPLMSAAMNGYTETVRVLLEYKADPGIKDTRCGYTALSLASERNHTQTVDLLKAREAGASAPSETNEASDDAPMVIGDSLHLAAAAGNVAEVQRLLARGVPVSAPGISLNEVVETPLNAAAYGVHPEVVRLLLEQGADVEGKGYHGRTPLADVADWRTKNIPETARVDVARLLLAHGARVDARDQQGCTPLMMAIKNNFPLLAGFLLEHKADPNAKDKEEHTPLYEALVINPFSDVPDEVRKTIVTLLLNNGAKAREQKDGWSPLIAAIRLRMDVETLRMFLDHGASAGYQSPIHTEYDYDDLGNRYEIGKRGGTTALAEAVDQKNPDLPTVRLLLERGARVNNTDANGRTPLHCAAAYCGNPDVLAMLLAAGANLNARTKIEDEYDEDDNGNWVKVGQFGGETPLDVAVRLDNPTAVRVLRGYGTR